MDKFIHEKFYNKILPLAIFRVNLLCLNYIFISTNNYYEKDY